MSILGFIGLVLVITAFVGLYIWEKKHTCKENKNEFCWGCGLCTATNDIELAQAKKKRKANNIANGCCTPAEYNEIVGVYNPMNFYDPLFPYVGFYTPPVIKDATEENINEVHTLNYDTDYNAFKDYERSEGPDVDSDFKSLEETMPPNNND